MHFLGINVAALLFQDLKKIFLYTSHMVKNRDRHIISYTVIRTIAQLYLYPCIFDHSEENQYCDRIIDLVMWRQSMTMPFQSGYLVWFKVEDVSNKLFPYLFLIVHKQNQSWVSWHVFMKACVVRD